jgi:hypothetical protein
VVALALKSTTILKRPRPWPRFMITEDARSRGLHHKSEMTGQFGLAARRLDIEWTARL